MATNKSRDLYRGLIIPDGDITTVWDKETTVDEAANRAGVPLATLQTEMILESSGHQTDTGAPSTLEVLSMRGGYPGGNKGGFVWNQTGALPAQEHRGWDPYNAVAQWENVDFDTNDANHQHLDLITKTKPDGSDLMFAFYDDFPTGLLQIDVEVRRRTSLGWASPTSIAVVEPPLGRPDLGSCPCALVLPSGRILVFFIVYDSSTLLLAGNVQMSYSDDDGATWRVGSSFCLRDRFDVRAGQLVPQLMKAAYKDGQIMLLIWFKDESAVLPAQPDRIFQYASDDLGATFYSISQFSGADTNNAGGFPDVTTDSGLFIVTWIARSDLKPRIDRLGSAFQLISPTAPPYPELAALFEWSDPALTPGIGDLTITADEDGAVYLVGFVYSSVSPLVDTAGVVFRSFEGAAMGTFEPMGAGFAPGPPSIRIGTWYRPATDDADASYIKPTNISATCHRGRLAIAHRYMGGDGSQATPLEAVGLGSLCVFYLGGFSQVTLPALTGFTSDITQVGFDSTWYPFAEPGTTAAAGVWTTFFVGVPPLISAIVTPGVYHLQTAPAGGGPGTQYFFRDVLPIGSATPAAVEYTEGLLGRFTGEVKYDGTPQTSEVVVWLYETGTDFCGFEIRIGITNITLTDSNGVVIAVEVPAAGMRDRKYQYFWAVRGLTGAGGLVSLWYRPWHADEDRTWINIGEDEPLPPDSGAGTTEVQWGARGPTSTFTGSNMWWSEFNYTYGGQDLGAGRLFGHTGMQLAQGQENPTELFPRSYASTPLYVDADTRIAAIDGPTFEGDLWTVEARHLSGLDNIFPQNSPSPAVMWRSKTANPGDTIAFLRNVDFVDAFPANDLYAIHFENVNFKRATVEVRIGAVWTTVGTVELWRAFCFERQGHTLRVSDQPPLHHFEEMEEGFYTYYNEFKGCKFEFMPDHGNEVATITRNSEGIGYFADATAGSRDTKRTTIFLDPDTFTEATAPATGTGAIWFRNVTVLIDMPVTSEFTAVRLSLCPTGTTLPPEEYYEIGNVVVGPVAVFGWDYSQERIVGREANVQLTTNRDGSRHAYKAGDPRRTVRFSWAQGVDVSELRRNYPAGDTDWGYVKTNATPGGSPIALRQDGELLMDGLVDRLDGSALPVVYLPKISHPPPVGPVSLPAFLGSYPDPRQFNRGAMYSRVVSPVTLETVVGSEDENEVYRLNTITIEGEK